MHSHQRVHRQRASACASHEQERLRGRGKETSNAKANAAYRLARRALDFSSLHSTHPPTQTDSALACFLRERVLIVVVDIQGLYTYTSLTIAGLGEGSVDQQPLRVRTGPWLQRQLYMAVHLSRSSERVSKTVAAKACAHLSP